MESTREKIENLIAGMYNLPRESVKITELYHEDGILHIRADIKMKFDLNRIFLHRQVHITFSLETPDNKIPCS